MTSLLAFAPPLCFAIAAYLVTRELAGARRPRPAWRAVLQPGPRAAVEPRRPHLRPRTWLSRMRAPGMLIDPATRVLAQAGMAERLTPHGLLALSTGSGLAGALGVLAIARVHGSDARSLAMAAFVGAIGAAAPWIVMHGRAGRRGQATEAALPDVLDLLTVSIEAGLALEAALARVAQRGDGPLHEELRRTLSEIGLGRRRRDALVALADRAGVAPLRSVVNALNQADRSGMRLGPVLRAQADQMRQRRRQRAEEAAMKAPLKMLFPLVGFVFPTIFLVVIGPAALNALQVLGGH